MAGGRATHAQDSRRQALEIFKRIGAAETQDLTAEVNADFNLMVPESMDAPE